MRKLARALCFLVVLVLLGRNARAQLVLTEFMADNRETLLDEDGEPSDWIEVYNQSDAVVSLAGWSLTDDAAEPSLWVFPARDLGPGEFVLVFASGKDRPTPDGELHANFKLSRQGEYLGLLNPEGAVASHFAPEYPEQLTDRTYGRAMELTRRTLLETGGRVSYLVPPDDVLGLTWVEPGLDASAWPIGDLPIGFDQKDEPTFGALVRTDVGAAMTRQTASLFLRGEFSVTAVDLGQFLELRLAYNDAFVLYVGGVEVACRNAFRPRVVRNSRGIFARRDELTTVYEGIPLYGAAESLQVGRNVLGLHALNHTNRNPDLFFDYAVESIVIESLGVESAVYFAVATPAWPNADARSAVAPPPQAVQQGGMRSAAIAVELRTSAVGGEIRYTMDGSEPNSRGLLYTEPLVIERPTVLKAKTFLTDSLPSRTMTESYFFLEPELAEFSSDLPLVIVNTFGTQIINDSFRPGYLSVIDPAASMDGRSRLLDGPQFSGDASFKVRGSSTSRRAKASFSVEIRDERDQDRDVDILDFPKESDFVLYGAFEFDRALMRNAFMYEMSNEAGRYAARTRFCEVFVNRTDDPVSQTHYLGVYSMIEKVERGEGRVDVKRLDPEDAVEPEISGGYLFKIDRLDPGDSGFSAGGQGFGHVDPKEEEITLVQKEWLVDYIDAFAAALDGPNFTDPDNGYARYIDVDAWIDHHILNEFSKNPDGLRLSTYFHKDREDRIVAGPIWDFDRALGPDADARAADPVGFSSLFQAHFWRRLFEDPAFLSRYKERWFELRIGPLSVSWMHGVIARMTAEITEGAGRNFAKWTILPADGWPTEVQQFRTWVEERVLWIDSQFVPSPRLSLSAGEVPVGRMLELAADGGEVFYTVDGTDPRAIDGTVSPGAILYEGMLTLDATIEIRARTRLGGTFWSELVSAVFTVTSEPPPPETLGRPGDFNQDQRINLADAVDFLMYLQGTLPHPCVDPGRVPLSDFNADARVDITDALGLLNFLFLRGAPHALGVECVVLEGCPVSCESL